jgi:nucleoside-diphosphate-sugar epimerase
MNTIENTNLHVVLGSGPAGANLATELARRGHQVRLVDRRGEGPGFEGVERYAADVSDAGQARVAIEGAEVVYHCVNVPYHLQVELMPGIQEAILTAVEAEGSRLVVLDTLYPYGNTHGAVMTEETPWAATTAKGRMRAELDERYLAAHREGRAGVVMGRSSDFFGPGVINSTLGGAVFPGALTGGEVAGLGDLDLLHNYTYIGDVASGLATLGEHSEADGRVWHLPTVEATTTRRIFRMIEDRVEGSLNVFTMHEPRPFGPFDEVFMNSYSELFYQHTEDQIMDSSAFQDAFGIGPTSLDEALDATIYWYRDWLASQQQEAS